MTSQYSERLRAEYFMRTRNERTFRRMYRDHTPALYQLAQRLVAGLEHDAEDIVQETWIRALRGLPQFRWKTTLGRWLASIAVNCFREMTRRRKLNVDSDCADIIDLAAAREIRGTISRVDLERALESISPGCREVLILHDIEGYTHAEVASMLGIEVGTSKSQLSKARRAMRARLSSIGGGRDAR